MNLNLKTLSALTALVCAFSTAHAATLCSGMSSPVAIDISVGTRRAALTETIRYSTVWETRESGAEVVVTINGETANTASGSGSFSWQPTCNGTYTLTHRVLANGQQVGATLTAIFEFRSSDWIATPVITPVDGTVLEGSSSVLMSCATEGATIHYTTDGTDPTTDSPEYRRFRVSGRTTVKAIAIKNGLYSEIAVAEYALGRCEVPVITAASSFTGSKTSVALSCTTEGATIHYTLDGSDPDGISVLYTEPFDVTESCTVKAYATFETFFDSSIASFSIQKVWGIGDTMGDPDQVFTTGGDLPFVRVTDETAPLGESMKSGAIADGRISTLSTMVDGPGVVSFLWKASCEDSGGQYDWDHAEFWVDGTPVAYLDGETGWRTVSLTVSGSGSHALEWRYVKDDVESAGQDCCWVADFGWVSSGFTETQTTPAHIPYVWLRSFYPDLVDEFDAYENAAKAVAANGVNAVWECYVAGLDPTNATSRFLAQIAVTNGTADVWWTPDLNEGGTKSERFYTIEGKTNLGDQSWGPTNESTRFFRVKVEMP